MAKITWEIHRAEYGYQFEVVANTRSQAVAIAEGEWLKATDYENELVGEPDEDGVIFTRSPIPQFTAKKIKH